jgi:hypothetical protein
MIAQRNASANAHVYTVGDLVYMSSRVLQPRVSTLPKMQPLYVGPLEVSHPLGPKTLSVQLPESYAVHNAFNLRTFVLGLIMQHVLLNRSILLLNLMLPQTLL